MKTKEPYMQQSMHHLLSLRFLSQIYASKTSSAQLREWRQGVVVGVKNGIMGVHPTLEPIKNIKC